MSYFATITDDSQPDGMPLWESPEQPTAKSAFDLAEHHIHRAQPEDVIAPLDGWGEYAVCNQSGGAPSTRVATLTVTTTGYSPDLTRDPRVVGGRYRSHHWDNEYTVDAITFDPHGWLTSITVTDNDGTRTHGTFWDPRDEILFDPRTVTRDDAARQP